jgi:hypothetical protein
MYSDFKWVRIWYKYGMSRFWRAQITFGFYPAFWRTQRFGNWTSFRPQVRWRRWHLLCGVSLEAANLENPIFCYVTQCSPLKVNRPSGGTCRLHIHGLRISQERNQCESSPWSRFRLEILHLLWSSEFHYCGFCVESADSRPRMRVCYIRNPTPA